MFNKYCKVALTLLALSGSAFGQIAIADPRASLFEDSSRIQFLNSEQSSLAETSGSTYSLTRAGKYSSLKTTIGSYNKTNNGDHEVEAGIAGTGSAIEISIGGTGSTGSNTTESSSKDDEIRIIIGGTGKFSGSLDNSAQYNHVRAGIGGTGSLSKDK